MLNAKACSNCKYVENKAAHPRCYHYSNYEHVYADVHKKSECHGLHWETKVIKKDTEILNITIDRRGEINYSYFRKTG